MGSPSDRQDHQQTPRNSRESLLSSHESASGGNDSDDEEESVISGNFHPPTRGAELERKFALMQQQVDKMELEQVQRIDKQANEFADQLDAAVKSLEASQSLQVEEIDKKMKTKHAEVSKTLKEVTRNQAKQQSDTGKLREQVGHLTTLLQQLNDRLDANQSVPAPNANTVATAPSRKEPPAKANKPRKSSKISSPVSKQKAEQSKADKLFQERFSQTEKSDQSNSEDEVFSLPAPRVSVYRKEGSKVKTSTPKSSDRSKKSGKKSISDVASSDGDDDDVLEAGSDPEQLQLSAYKLKMPKPKNVDNKIVIMSDPFTGIGKYDSTKAIPTFSDWYRTEFYPVAVEANLNDEDACKKLRPCLDHSAKQAYDLAFNKKKKHSLKHIVAALEKHFSPEEPLSLDVVYQRRMRSDENVKKYALELETLYDKVNPDASEDEKQTVLARVFRKGIPADLLTHCRIFPFPKRLDQMVRIVAHYEKEWLMSLRGRQDPSAALRAVIPPRSDAQQTQRRYQPGVSHNYGRRSPDTADRHVHFDLRPPKEHHDQQQRRSPPPSPSPPPGCEFCGRHNHDPRDCFFRPREGPAYPQRGSHAMGRGGYPNRGTFNAPRGRGNIQKNPGPGGGYHPGRGGAYHPGQGGGYHPGRGGGYHPGHQGGYYRDRDQDHRYIEVQDARLDPRFGGPNPPQQHQARARSASPNQHHQAAGPSGYRGAAGPSGQSGQKKN